MENTIKGKGQASNTRADRGNAVLYPHPIIGIVKNNIDPTGTGRIQVFLKLPDSPNEDDSNKWTTVSYMSPFFGYTPNTSSSKDYGNFVGNPHSYGFWATPPDLNTEVLCVFVNGDPNFGYYLGGLPREGMTQMVPAIGASSSIIANGAEANSYGGASRLPVAEINNAYTKQDQSTSLTKQPKVVHSYQASILNKQGLIRDNDRGVISSSAQRESPSRVFGISTPGRPIYQGGYDDSSVTDAITGSAPNQNFKVIGRTGGHTLVMDDGDLNGRDQLVRLRTTNGHMIMMNDAAQTLFIIHSNGESYIELGKEGTIDMYSTNSVNIRTQGDLNLHADNNVNIQAGKDVKISGTNIKTEASGDQTSLTMGAFSQQVKGNYTNKIDGSMGISTGGDSNFVAGSDLCFTGAKVNLNSGTGSLTPAAVAQMPTISHADTLFDGEKGFIPAPGKLQSIVTRAPAHQPWQNGNKGVDVKVNLSASANLPQAPAAPLAAVNNSAPPAPAVATTPALAATVPNVPAVSDQLDKATTGTLVSQMAANASASIPSDVMSQGAGIVKNPDGTSLAVVGGLGLNPSKLAEAGVLKPGADVAVNAAIQNGASLEQAMPSSMFTGKDGVNNIGQLVGNTGAQANAAVSLMAKGESALKDSGIISGKESGTQTAGLVLSAATLGIKPTADFAKSLVGNLGSSIPSGASLSGAASSLADNVKAGLGSIGGLGSTLGTGNPADLVAGGNLAAGLKDKAMGGLAGLTSLKDSAAGAASAAFDKIKSTFKSFTPGVPQNLAEIKAKTDAESAAADAKTGGDSPKLSDMASKALNAVKSGAIPNVNLAALGVPAGLAGAISSAGGISGLASKASSLLDKAKSSNPATDIAIPGGSDALATAVDASSSAPPAVPGSSMISSAIGKVTSAASNALGGITGELSDIKTKIMGAGGLTALASNGLTDSASAKLNGMLGSLGSGGPVDVKLPIVASNTTDNAEINNQVKGLLGDDKIPVPASFKAPAPLSADQLAKIDTLKNDLDTKSDKQWDLRQTYLDNKTKYGADNPITVASNDAYKQCLKDIESIQSQIGSTSLGA